MSAQSSVEPDTGKVAYRYAELVGIIGGFSSKVKVEINFGENVTGWFRTPEMLTDPETGKAIKFNSMIDALNHMSMRGWELVQSYMTSAQGITEQHFIIRRKEYFSK